MKKMLLLTLLLWPAAAFAQGLPAPPSLPSFQDQRAAVSGSPQCFIVRNTTPNKVFGHIETDFFPRDDGLKTRHRSTFKLLPLGERDKKSGDFLDRAQFCTTGPFYPGGKVVLELKTLFPVFSCKTRVDQGEILIESLRIDGDYELWATCYE